MKEEGEQVRHWLHGMPRQIRHQDLQGLEDFIDLLLVAARRDELPLQLGDALEHTALQAVLAGLVDAEPGWHMSGERMQGVEVEVDRFLAPLPAQPLHEFRMLAELACR